MTTQERARHQPGRRPTPQPRLPNPQQPGSLRRRVQQLLGTRIKHCSTHRHNPISLSRLLGPTAPRLAFQRIDQDRAVDAPLFASADLQDEHVVGVIVGGEALAGQRFR